MTEASGEINLEIAISFVTQRKVKAARPVHSMADVIPFSIVFNIRRKSGLEKH